MEQLSIDHTVDDESEPDQPSPTDFDEYLPWACTQVQADTTVVITRVTQEEYHSALADKKKKKSKPPSHLELESGHEFNIAASDSLPEDKVVHIFTVYDYNENLVQLKFYKNCRISRVILKLIGLIIPYHPTLTTIMINHGMDQFSLYEISKFLHVSNITEMILDNAVVKEANYYLLLEKPNTIRYLSLARCSINDDVVKTITDMLVYPMPSSKTLSILNLPTNKITDVGAKYIGECLRSNRQLSYLNLADNMLTDCGAEELLKCLKTFPLTFHELLTSRTRHMHYIKEKNEFILHMAQDLRSDESDRRAVKRKSPKSAQVPAGKKTKLEKESSLKGMPESTSAFLDKASILAHQTLGDFNDPFSKANISLVNGVVCSRGNNSLSYLNLSYNNLSYLFLKRLEEVLLYQGQADRKPRGLVNVNVEGNFLPGSCLELEVIDRVLNLNLSMLGRPRGFSITGKKSRMRKGVDAE